MVPCQSRLDRRSLQRLRAGAEALTASGGYLITGTRSGLGRHLHERFGGTVWRRDTPEEGKRESLRRSGIGVVIHCASNSARRVDTENAYAYYSDNVCLTDELTRIPCRKFIFVSTVDVYPKDSAVHHENETIELDRGQNVYALTKLFSEAIVRSRCANFLILRCAGLLGAHIRPNNVVRMLDDRPCVLSLASTSEVNYVSHSDVAAVISRAIELDTQGIVNVASASNTTLREIASAIGADVKFGTYRYDVGHVSNERATAMHPGLLRPTLDVVRAFARDRASVGRP